MTTTPDDPRPTNGSRTGRRPVLFSRPPLDDPEALERWIADFVTLVKTEIDLSK
jgi:hypothetical protein